MDGLLSALLSKVPGTTKGTWQESQMPWSDGVRRQGLEPRTRGLRVRCSAS
jgi:hypothetical protein